nr:retrovirus-related Pol polyprotein from transposon TNT 1-94 [Tanacetum cinerariifolium]
MTPRTISSGLVQNIPSSTLYVPPTMNNCEILLQPMFDVYLNPPPCVNLQVLAVIALDDAISTVWEMVPRPDQVMNITLKWIYKVKLDELEASNTPDPSILTSDITLSKSKWRTGWLSCFFVKTEYQLEDIFTKPLAREQLAFLIKKLGMRSMSHETLKKLADEEEE